MSESTNSTEHESPESGYGPCPHCGQMRRYYYHANEACYSCIDQWTDPAAPLEEDVEDSSVESTDLFGELLLWLESQRDYYRTGEMMSMAESIHGEAMMDSVIAKIKSLTPNGKVEAPNA